VKYKASMRSTAILECTVFNSWLNSEAVQRPRFKIIMYSLVKINLFIENDRTSLITKHP